MLMPSVFGESLFDDLMDFPFEKEFFGRRNPLYGKHAQNIMKTDIKETDVAYEMDIDHTYTSFQAAVGATCFGGSSFYAYAWTP